MGPFSDFQYGFRSSRSTTDLLTVVYDRIPIAFNRSGATQAVVLVYPRLSTRFRMLVVFTKVSHGISGSVFVFISSFLTNARLHVFPDGKPQQEYPVNSWVAQGSIPCAFLLYLPENILCKIAIFADDNTFYSKYEQASHLCQQPELASGLESDLRDTVDCGKNWLVNLRAGKTQFVSFDWSSSSCAFDVKMEGTVLQEKSFFFKCWGYLSLLNWIRALALSLLLKLLQRKFDSRFFLWIFFLLRLLFVSSTTQACMEYCYLDWNGAPNCYLDKLQQRVSRSAGPSLPASYEHLAHQF